MNYLLTINKKAQEVSAGEGMTKLRQEVVKSGLKSSAVLTRHYMTNGQMICEKVVEFKPETAELKLYR